MDERQFFDVLSDLSMHAIAVGATQATNDCIAKYPTFAPYKPELYLYLQNIVNNNNLSIQMHYGITSEEKQDGTIHKLS